MNDSQSKHDSEPASDQTWGGPHVQLLMTSSGAEVEFDCATGRINTRIQTNSEGKFDVAGTFRREGGPVRSDDSRGQTVRYIGNIAGDSMTLQVHFPDQEQTTETYKLKRGSQGRLWKCR